MRIVGHDLLHFLAAFIRGAIVHNNNPSPGTHLRQPAKTLLDITGFVMARNDNRTREQRTRHARARGDVLDRRNEAKYGHLWYDRIEQGPDNRNALGNRQCEAIFYDVETLKMQDAADILVGNKVSR